MLGCRWGAFFRFEKTMTEQQDDREHEEVLCAYFLQNAGFEDTRPELAAMEWDPIDPALPGCIDTTRLRTYSKRWRWTGSLEQLASSFEPIKRKGRVKVSTVSVAKWLPRVRWEELRRIGLLRDLAAPKQERARCGMFGVEKVGKRKLRVIFDARPANELLEPRPEKLLLFTLPQLIDSFRRFRHIHTIDYRHYYYQFKLPAGLRLWFVVKNGDKCYVPCPPRSTHIQNKG